MTHQADKYLAKLFKHKTADEAVFIMTDCGTDTRGNITPDGELLAVANELGVYTLLFARPSEPFMSVLNHAAINGEFAPNDSETRTFLHTVPVLDKINAKGIAAALRRRKAVFIKDKGIVTAAPYGAEQAYVFFCSVCFSGFVKFFSDAGNAAVQNQPYDKIKVRELAESYERFIPPLEMPLLRKNIFTSDADIIGAMAEAGRATVDMGLVDAFYGNISVLNEGKIYISRTGSSLDELDKETDICPVDESACTGLTASSEMASHRKIYELTNNRLILHGHPRFSVIMSMVCGKKCDKRGRCHYECDKDRFISGTPIVPGEVGNGKRAMVNTMPPAMKIYNSAIVYGHGVFTAAHDDFNSAFRRLYEIETDALTLYKHLAC